MKKGSLPINIILVLFIAVVSISLLIGLFVTKVPGFTKAIYCKTFFHLHSATFVPDTIRQDQSYCAIENNLDVHILTNETLIDETVLSFALACYDRSSFGDYKKSIQCYELSIPPTICIGGCTITENQLITILFTEDVCAVFPVINGANECPVGATQDMLDVGRGSGQITLIPGRNFIVEWDGTKVQIY